MLVEVITKILIFLLLKAKSKKFGDAKLKGPLGIASYRD